MSDSVRGDSSWLYTLTPLAATPGPQVTWRDIVEVVGDLRLPDPGFGDDLAAIQSEQPLMEEGPWGS